MTPERYKEVGRLYHAALELEPARWTAYLAEACGGDEALRREVESLLDYEACGERLIDQPALEAAAKAMAQAMGKDQSESEVASLMGGTVGHFQILSLLGKGGMGEVHLALDPHLQRKVAIKLLPARFTTDAGRVRRFAQEARAASALNHPNILTIHEIGENEGAHYIVTEYVEGETLRQRLTSAPDQQLQISEALAVAAQIAEALAAAHEAGIVHRDIKPENVMVRRDGYVKVLDFGLAKLTEPASPTADPQIPTFTANSTEAGMVMGTPRYMSPEQARGEKVDARTDIFSLGIILYEMIAGQPPFAGTTPSGMIAAILQDEPLPLVEYAPAMPPVLERIIRQTLRKDRAERHQSVKDLLADLQQLKKRLEYEEEVKREAKLSSAGGLPSVPSATPNAAVTEIVADQSEGAWRIMATDQRDPAVHSIIPPVPHPPHPNTAPMIVRTSLPVEKRDKESGLRSWRRKGALGLAAVLLLAVVGTMRFWPSRERQPDSPHGIKVARLTNGGYIHNAVLSPDGKYFAYTEQDGAAARLWLRQVAGGQPVMLVPEIEHPILGLTFAPDSQAIYFVTTDQSNPQGSLYRVPALGGPATKLLMGINSPVTFAPDGRRLAFIRMEENGESTSLVLADITGDNERIVLTRGGLERFGSDGPSWSPNGKEIACQLLRGLTQNSDEAWRIVGVDIQSGSQRLLTTQQWDGCGRVIWLRDGRGLVMIGTKQGESSTTARDAVWFITQPDGAIRRITTDISRHFYRSVSVTDDGQSLLVLPFNRTSQIWSVEVRGQGEKTRYDAASTVQLTTGTGDGRAGIVSLDDGSIVYVARTGEHVDLWRMNNNGGQQQQLTTAPPFLEEVSAPPDGRFFVFVSNHAGYSHLFRVDRDGTNLRQLTSGESREVDSDCSPDGRWIIYSSQSSLPGKIAEFKLWKIPAEGGAPVSLTDTESYTPHFSPDGRWISYIRPGRVAIISADGGAPVKTFEVPRSAEWNIGYRWTPDGQALTYVVKGKTCDNLWLQPLNGRAPQALTDFNSGEIYNYSFAHNGQRLFLARGYSIRDVLLIREFR